MNKTIGYILNIDGDNTDLSPLLGHRSLSTLPFGGRYRLIDFSLSNLVNSGVRHVGVVGSHKYSSLVDHLGTGKEWSLSRKTQDLSILAGSGAARFNDLVKINTRDLCNNRAFLDRSDVETVIITAPNLVTSFDFREAVAIHKTNRADVTLIYRTKSANRMTTDVYLDMDGHRVSGIAYAPDDDHDYVYADMLIIRKDILIKLMNLSQRTGEWDLMDIIRDNLDTLRIFGAIHEGYLHNIYNMASYYRISMDLLEEQTMAALFLTGNPIYTKIKDNHPTRYYDDATITSAIIGSGCKIHGSVKDSILFRDSLVGEDTTVEHCILMQKTKIGKNVRLEYVICDKDVRIRDNTQLIGTEDAPVVIEKGRTL